MLKGPQEILLESEVCKLSFLDEFHRKLSQRVNSKEGNILIGITPYLQVDKKKEVYVYNCIYKVTFTFENSPHIFQLCWFS